MEEITFISAIGKFQFWEVSTILLDNLKGQPRDKFHKLRGIFMWNVCIAISYFLGDFPEFLLHSMIQLRENHASSAYARFTLA